MSMVRIRDSSPAGIPPTTAPHPEEMRASFDLTVGRSVALTASARATPAGLIGAALLAAAIFVPLAMIVRARGSDRRHR